MLSAFAKIQLSNVPAVLLNLCFFVQSVIHQQQSKRKSARISPNQRVIHTSLTKEKHSIIEKISDGRVKGKR